jgi:nitroreductase
MKNDMFKDLVANRATCRSFSNTPVPVEYINVLKTAVGLSPSKNNKLPCRVVILGPNAKTEKETLYDASHCGPTHPEMRNPQLLAPYVFLFLPRAEAKTEYEWSEKRWQKHTCIQAGICSATLVWCAESLGLSTGYCGAVDGSMGEEGSYVAEMIVAVGVGYPRTKINDKRVRNKPNDTTLNNDTFDVEKRIAISDWIEEIGM